MRTRDQTHKNTLLNRNSSVPILRNTVLAIPYGQNFEGLSSDEEDIIIQERKEPVQETEEEDWIEEERESVSSRDFDNSLHLDISLVIRTCVLHSLKEEEKETSSEDGIVMDVVSKDGFKEKMYIDMDDFGKMAQYHVVPTGSRSSITVYDFAPKVFLALRKKFHISHEHYVWSWSSPCLSESKSEGKSKSWFVASRDQEYLVKTISKSEFKTMLSNLADMAVHWNMYPHSLINQVHGLHRIKRKGKSLYIMVLDNILGKVPLVSVPSLQLYDLKGSTCGRKAKQGDKVLKDLDWKEPLSLHPNTKKAMLRQLEIDVALLQSHDIMDYSLLVGMLSRSSLSPSSSFEAFQLDEAPMIRKLSLSDHRPGSSPKPLLRRQSSLQSSLSAADKAPRPQSSLRTSGKDASRKGSASITRVPSMVFFAEPKKAQTSRRSKADTKKFERVRSNSMQELPLKKADDVPIQHPWKGPFGGVLSLEGDCVYMIGVIDTLQVFNAKKKAARLFKSIGHDADGLSTVKPSVYAKRFIDFVRERVLK